jgi:DNA primase
VFIIKKDGNRKMPAALESYLSIHHDVKEIVLRMDNDAVGRDAAESIRATIETLTVTIELPEQGKDYNEWLMLQKGISTTRKKAPAKAHTEPER